MKKIYISLENCYGIQKLNQTFEFDDSSKKAHLIYAPNGVMKTSFANTLKDICLGKKSEDCFYPERKTIRKVKFNDDNGADLSKNDILVIQPYADNYKSENVSVLLADEELKKRYEDIHKDIDEKMRRVFSVLDSLSGKRNSENILATDFAYNDKNIYDCLEKIYMECKNLDKKDYSNIKYSKIITADSEKVLSDKEVIKQLNAYIEQYEKLLTTSNIFKVVFNHNNAEDVIKVLDRDGFFKAKHQVILADTDQPIGKKEFEKVITDEKKRILDIELSDEFNKIDTLLSAKAGTKVLRDFILDNRTIIPELMNLTEFKKKIWISYLFSDYSTFQEAIINYQNNKKKLEIIVKSAKEQSSKWNNVVLQFNERFSNMPFRLKINNKEDVVLNSDMPTVSFIYKSRGQETPVEFENLLLHLSNGEKKALYLLNIIFEIEARKELGLSTFLIMDDIADSFDYRNKYAIIEYIKDIVDDDLFMPIILTHNFDFYRTVASRVEIKPTSNFINKSVEELTLVHGQYFENVFDKWRDQVYSNDMIFISSIAFVRNLTEYISGCKDDIYNDLTSLLHYKKAEIDGVMASDSIVVRNLCEWYRRVWGRDISKFSQDTTQRVIDLIFDTADKIVSQDSNTICIENKIVLSIAIRQKAERYMVNRINDDEKVFAIKRYQTRKLRDLINFDKSDPNDLKSEEIIERVLIITSENIHINSFMYEPIVDMSLEELVKLYNDVNMLSSS